MSAESAAPRSSDDSPIPLSAQSAAARWGATPRWWRTHLPELVSTGCAARRGRIVWARPSMAVALARRRNRRAPRAPGRRCAVSAQASLIPQAHAIAERVELAVRDLDDAELEALRAALQRAHDVAGGELVRRAGGER